MPNEEHLALLRRGIFDWNRWRTSNLEIAPDLTGADLRGANLTVAKLSGANLTEADLSGADLIQTDLSGATLTSANFTEANLSGANLTGADLAFAILHEANLTRTDFSGADLTEADLTWAILTKADLTGADLSRAKIQYTSLSNVDLSVAKGLESSIHNGPASIGLDTILKSQGAIPPRFLRGCGYDPTVQAMLTGDPKSKTDGFYEWLDKGGGAFKLDSFFISYSSKDTDFVSRLQRALNSRSVDYWYAPEHGRWGEKLTSQIDHEISVRDRVILVCSRASLSESDWVQWEIERTLAEERKREKTIIFPIMIDNALIEWNHPRATYIREILAGDFQKATQGKAFEHAVDRLVQGLMK